MKKRAKIIVIILIILILSLTAFHFYFLRDPEIKITDDKKAVLSPASGKIIKIMKFSGNIVDNLTIEKGLIGKINTETEDICENKTCYLISIFMNPLNVHIQRASLEGKVISVEHKSGTLLPTTTFKNGLTNEKTETIIENLAIGKIKIIQIAGFIVRRIENWLVVGENLEKGERIGRIKYGSQVSLIIPAENIEITAREGDKVESGLSILGKIK